MKRVTGASLLALALAALPACNYAETASPLAPASTSAGPTPTATTATLTGPEVISRVAAMYPERLAGGISHEQRIENMAFLRDRIIEVGTCGGLLLARNTKANGLISIDAINWRHGAEDTNDVVDIALDYDNDARPLQLHWMVTHGPAGWTPIEVHCS